MATFAIQAVDSIIHLPIEPAQKIVKLQRCVNLLQRLLHEYTIDTEQGITRDTYRPVAQKVIKESQRRKRINERKQK